MIKPIVIMALLCALSGCSSAPPDVATVAPTVKEEAAKPEPAEQKPAPEKQEPPQLLHAGDSFNFADDKDLEYFFNGIVKKKKIGNAYIGKSAEPGAIYVILNFKILNHGKQTATIAADNYRLQAPDGTTFSPDSEAASSLIMAGGKTDFVLTELQPGVKKAGATVFEMPDAQAKGQLFWMVADRAGGDPATVRIQ